MIVTIDGPAGAGKSSVARALAVRLGFAFLDTGAMYRAVTLHVLRGQLDLADSGRLGQILNDLNLQMPPGAIHLNGEDVTAAIRTQEVTRATSAVADHPAVRHKLVGLQREVAKGKKLVTEGRDQGTIVFPEAPCKFFLTADPMERARRRQREMLEKGEAVELRVLFEAIVTRDQRDAERAIAPLKPATDAVIVDTTGRDFDEVVVSMEREVKRRQV